MSPKILREHRRCARNFNVNQVGKDQHLELMERKARKQRHYAILLEIHEQHQKDKEENKK